MNVATKAPHDSLQFAYVKIHFAKDNDEDLMVWKVWYVDPVKIRIREVIFEGGVEQEGANFWVPWQAIDSIRELEKEERNVGN
jgi:hypothetical protein